jgi:hypothetical protein
MAEYKQRILADSDAAAQPGAIGALLRREGLYSSHLVTAPQTASRHRFGKAEAGQPGRCAADPDQMSEVRLPVSRIQREAICNRACSRSRWSVGGTNFEPDSAKVVVSHQRT